ncbi:MAG: hypothetical protein Q8P86_02625 [bacterium]|nr:hypothetical protein [bacterium]
MSRKTAFIIIIVIVLILLGVLFWLYSSQSEKDGGMFGEFPTSPIFPGGGSGGEEEPTEEQGGGTFTENPRLLNKISETPVAGASIFSKTEDDEETVYIRHVDRGIGNIFETDLRTLEQIRISNKTIPKVYEALWKNDGSEVILRYLDESERIISFHAEISDELPEEETLQGTFLPQGIPHIAVSPDSSSIFYISPNSGGSTGITADFDGGGRSQIWSSPLREWLPSWASLSTVALFSKPGFAVAGSLFFVNNQNGAVRNILNDVSGLTALPNPDGTLILLSSGDRTGLSTSVLTVSDGKTENFLTTTMPEKCVWSREETSTVYCAVPITLPQAAYPDEWYKGKVSFLDDIWKIDVETGLSEFVANLKSESGEEIDAIELKLSPNEDYLIFTNKKDLSLWSLKLENL